MAALLVCGPAGERWVCLCSAPGKGLGDAVEETKKPDDVVSAPEVNGLGKALSFMALIERLPRDA